MEKNNGSKETSCVHKEIKSVKMKTALAIHVLVQRMNVVVNNNGE